MDIVLRGTSASWISSERHRHVYSSPSLQVLSNRNQQQASPSEDKQNKKEEFTSSDVRSRAQLPSTALGWKPF
jgi:hypothetical protein